MNCISDPTRRKLLAAALALRALARPARAWAHEHEGISAIRTVADFNAATWAQLLRTGPRPAAYVFTTTYCSACPAVFELLHAHIAAAHRPVELAAVVMDAQGERALAHARHYRGISRLYAFDGFEPEIRYAVDPKWRNITPYVVLLAEQGTGQRVIGPPDAARLHAWLN